MRTELYKEPVLIDFNLSYFPKIVKSVINDQ